MKLIRNTRNQRQARENVFDQIVIGFGLHSLLFEDRKNDEKRLNMNQTHTRLYVLEMFVFKYELSIGITFLKCDLFSL